MNIVLMPAVEQKLEALFHPELLQKFDINGPRYTFYPSADPDNEKDRAKVEAYGRRKIEGLAQAALNFVSPLTAVLNTEGVIILVNSAWRSAAMLYPKLKGGSLGCEGVNYLAVCEKAKGPGSEEASKVARFIRDVIAENTKTFTSKYPCHSKGDKRWFEVKASAYKHFDDVYCVVTHIPITEATFKKKN
jgi:hypothetical protein